MTKSLINHIFSRINFNYLNNKETFFQLLKYSNELEKNKKYLIREDPAAFKKLLKFLVILEENLHWEVKNQYVELMKDFLNGMISADDFSISFIRIFDKTRAIRN
jgi:heme oxygenase